MKLGEFIEKYELPDSCEVNRIPIKHPETKEKIYIKSRWFNGFWYQMFPGPLYGRVYPCQYACDLTDLEIYARAKKELENIRKLYAQLRS